MTETRTRSYEANVDVEHEHDGKANPRDAGGYYTYHEPSLGELFSDLSREFSTLVREEMRLAQMEMSHKAKRAGKDAAYAAAGGFIAYAGFIVLLLAAVIGLSYFMPDWLAALIVGLVTAAIGGLLAGRGIGDLRKIDPAPKQTIQTLQEDQEFFKRQMR